MAKVQLHQISKSFDNTAVLDNISLTIEDGEFFFLLGPSGCGKTTLLRLIAGFNPPDHGRILLNNKDVTEVPPHKRHTAMVFQNYALWPHMTIRENLAFGLNLQHLSTTEKKDRVNKALQMVQMETYAERTPNQLSGGQQQRVALGRALVLEPAVVLLDEPLSNLDAKLRLDMRVHLQELHQRLNLTMIYVTHDQNEALSLADRMAVLQDGRIRQIGKPREIYDQPANTFVADFIGETNFLTGIIREKNTQITIETEIGTIISTKPVEKLQLGDEVVCSIRPEDIRVLSPGDSRPNMIAGHVNRRNYLGNLERYFIRLKNQQDIKSIEFNSREVKARKGEAVQIGFYPDDVVVLRKEA